MAAASSHMGNPFVGLQVDQTGIRLLRTRWKKCRVSWLGSTFGATASAKGSSGTTSGQVLHRLCGGPPKSDWLSRAVLAGTTLHCQRRWTGRGGGLARAHGRDLQRFLAPSSAGQGGDAGRPLLERLLGRELRQMKRTSKGMTLNGKRSEFF